MSKLLLIYSNSPEIYSIINGLLKRTDKLDCITQSTQETCGRYQLIGRSPVFLEEVSKIPRIAQCNASILISGETGTGKELCARSIHFLSPRCQGPFVPVNCGAIPVDLVENELFGHKREAFTGAFSTRAGLIEEAEGGTLFLDEIDCLPPAAQVKLLRFLEEKEYRALGSMEIKRVDVRILAATNVDPQTAVKEGRIRQDLYHRLNFVPLCLPPLRQRPEDIPLLAIHFLAKYASEFQREARVISFEAMRRLVLYDWPGNVRELENVMGRAVLMNDGEAIEKKDIHVAGRLSTDLEEGFRDAKSKVVDQFEKSYIQRILALHQGNIAAAARAARKNRRAFWRIMHKHGIDAGHFRALQSSGKHSAPDK